MIKQLDVGLGINTAPFEAGLSKAGGMFGAFTAAQAAKLAALNKEMAAIGGSVKGLQGFDMFGKSIDGANAKLSKTPFILKGVQSAAMGATAVLGGIFGIGIAEAMKFESAMTKVRALTTSSAEDLELYAKSIKQIGIETGTGPEKLAESLYYVASAGITGAKGLDVVKFSAMGAQMGMGEASQIGKLLSATINAFPNSAMTAEKSFDLLSQTVRYGAAGAADYAGVLGNVLAIAESTGQSLEQVYAAVATYTRTGQSAGQATTALRQILVGINAPSRMAADAFKLLAAKGYDIKKTLSEQGVNAALMQLHQAVGKNAEAYRVLFPSVEAMNMALALGGTQAKSYGEALSGISKSAGSGSAAFAEYQKTTGYQMQQLKVEMQVAFEDIGAAAMPMFRSLLPTFRELGLTILHVVGSFAKLPQPVQMAVLGFVATAGPLAKLVGGLGQLAPAATAVGGGLAKLGPPLLGAATSFGAVVTNAGRAAVGLPALIAPTLATQAAFFSLQGTLIAAASALGTAAAALAVFYVAYQATSALMSVQVGGKALSDWTGDALSLVTGMQLVNKVAEQGQQVMGTWTFEEQRVYKAHVERMKGLQAITAEQWEATRKAAVENVAALNAIGFGVNVGSALGKSAVPGADLDAFGGGFSMVPKKPAAAFSMTTPIAGAAGADVAGLGGGEGDPAKMSEPIRLSRDMIKEWRKEGVGAKKTAEEWKKAIADLSGATAATEMDALRQQVVALGGVSNVKNVESLVKQIEKLADEGATIPKELIPALVADQARKSAEAMAAFGKSIYTAGTEAEKVDFEAIANSMMPWLASLDLLGPSTEEVTRQFGNLKTVLDLGGGIGKTSDVGLKNMIAEMEKLGDTGKLTGEQWSLLGDLYTEALGRGLLGTQEATKAAFEWGVALQGVALMAGAIGGSFGDTMKVVGNIGESFKGYKDMTGTQKFGAIAGGVGSIGGLIGAKNRKTGGALQGAAGGAMAGAAIGSIVPGIGTVVGGVVGGVAGAVGGFLGGRKKEKEEKAAKLAEEKKLYEDLTKSMESQYGSILKARNAARLYGIDIKAAMDPKNPKALEAALKDLEKKQKGMQTAMAGAAGLAAYKPTSDAGAQAQGALFGSVFWAAVKTEGLTAAASALGEPFEKMWEGASASMQTMLAPIRQQLDLAKNESFAAAAEGANALSQILSGLADAGVVSIGDLANASTLATDQYNQALAAAQEQGLAPAAAQEAAIRAVGPAVAELIAQYDALGIPLDENLQKLKDTASASGVMFPEEPMVRAAEAMERVAAALEKSFGLSTGLADNVDRIGRGRIPGSSDTGNNNRNADASFASGTRGPVVVQRDMLAQIHAGEGLMVIPKNEMPTSGIGYGSFRRGTEEGEDPPEGRRGGGGGSSDSPSESSSAASVVDALVEQVKALAEAVADRGTPISIDNPVSVQIVDQSAVKTVEGQRAFGKFVVSEVERALDQNSRGLTTKIEDIARRAAR